MFYLPFSNTIIVSKEDVYMKSLFTKYVWLQLILSILLLFGGALIVVFAVLGKQNILEEGLNIIVAVILFLFGFFAILASFAFESDRVFTNGLLYGSACIALGVFLCIRELVLLNYLVMLLAIFFIVIGAVELFTRRYAHAGKERCVQTVSLGLGERIVPLDYCNVGIAFLRGSRYHIIGNAASQSPFLDAGVHGKGRQGALRWHNY